MHFENDGSVAFVRGTSAGAVIHLLMQPTPTKAGAMAALSPVQTLCGRWSANPYSRDENAFYPL
jgi:hypothetical protein